MFKHLTLPQRIDAGTGYRVRGARLEDLDALMLLLADDPISAARGDQARPQDRPLYAAALQRLIADPSNGVFVLEDDKDEQAQVLGTFQLTVIAGLARRGSTRLIVEAVRVRSDARSSGLGSAMMRWVMQQAAPALGVDLIQLTSDAARVQAHRFYERLGFTGSHVGFKYRLP